MAKSTTTFALGSDSRRIVTGCLPAGSRIVVRENETPGVWRSTIVTGMSGTVTFAYGSLTLETNVSSSTVRSGSATSEYTGTRSIGTCSSKFVRLNRSRARCAAPEVGLSTIQFTSELASSTTTSSDPGGAPASHTCARTGVASSVA